jgi:tellurite resistance protein TerC
VPAGSEHGVPFRGVLDALVPRGPFVLSGDAAAHRFIDLTSNVLPIFGLRVLYFCPAAFVDQLLYLKLGLGWVLSFVVAKMLASDFYRVPIGVSLGVVAGILTVSAAASLLAPPRPLLDHGDPGPGPRAGGDD